MEKEKPNLLLDIQDMQLRENLTGRESIQGFNLVWTEEGHGWMETVKPSGIDVVIVQADDFSNADLEKLVASQICHSTDVMFITGGLPNSIVDAATKQGACYHLRQPVDFEYIDQLLAEVYEGFIQQRDTEDVVITSDLDQFGLLVGSSMPMHRLYRNIRKAAQSRAKILLTGESGVGKELVANTIHLVGPNKTKPFVALNCGALSPELVESELFGHTKGAFTGAGKDRAGMIEKAEGGTLFLDEITEMPLDLQVKLLRVLETGEYKPVGSDENKTAHMQVIAATNRDPVQAIQEEKLRKDLYFRLAHFPVHVAPLRERGSDITGLAKHFLAYRNAQENTSKGITQAALDKISKHAWPGNVRELKYVIERAYLLAPQIIDVEHIVIEDIDKIADENLQVPTGVPLDEVEQQVILQTLEQNQDKKSETANQLGISVKTLYNKLEKYQKESN